MSDLFELRSPASTAGVLVNVPHAGTKLPAGLTDSLSEAARSLPDTDWHADRLVEDISESGAGLMRACYSRYLIDLNRGADNQPLYAGPTTGLVPAETFSGEPVYPASPPDEAELNRRIDRYWRPYHDALATELEAIRERHCFAVLLDVHSIRSTVPRLFEGRLPDLNLGTYDGRSCTPELEQGVARLFERQDRFSHVINGRFKGGFITRHYGQPDSGVHALQLEIAQACYMDESNPEHYDEVRARPLRQLLHELVEYLVEWRPA